MSAPERSEGHGGSEVTDKKAGEPEANTAKATPEPTPEGQQANSGGKRASKGSESSERSRSAGAAARGEADGAIEPPEQARRAAANEQTSDPSEAREAPRVCLLARGGRLGGFLREQFASPRAYARGRSTRDYVALNPVRRETSEARNATATERHAPESVAIGGEGGQSVAKRSEHRPTRGRQKRANDATMNPEAQAKPSNVLRMGVWNCRVDVG